MGMLEGKTALVTGGNRGLGRAIAERFAAEGAQVVLAVRDAEAGRAVADELSGRGGGACWAVACDVANPDAVKAAFREVFARTKRLDVLVNNAGVLGDGMFGMVTPAELERVFAVNTFGAFHCTQYAARLMQRGGGGSVINLASVVARTGEVGLSAYAASKAALIGLTRSLAKELAPSGVRVNAIAPGYIDTDMARGLPEAKLAERLGPVAMGRLGRPEEVAGVALFLASDLASYVTGQVVGVDGGMPG